MKIVILMRGPGEVSQGYALGSYFIQQNYEVHFVLVSQINLSFFPHHTSLNITMLSHEHGTIENQFVQFVEKLKPNTVILCNSKSFSSSDFVEIPAWKDIPLFTLDSNWIFKKQNKGFQYVKWAEKYFINIPEPIFNYGLKQNGGDFEIDDDIMNKIQVIGLIPSYKKINKKIRTQWRKSNNYEERKLIFCYVSGQGAGSRFWVLENLIASVKQLIQMGKKITILVSGIIEDEQVLLYPWCKYLGQNLDMESFYLALSASDLVFQHQGLATLEQAICAEVPVIANVTDYPRESIPKIHTYELTPFEKAEVCKLLYKNTHQEEIQNTVNALLYDENVRKKMIENQKKLYNHGEEEVYNAINEMVHYKK